MRSFIIPACPADLLNPSDDTHLTVQNNTAVAALKAEDVQSLSDGETFCSICGITQERMHSHTSPLYAGVVYDLVSDTALCIVNQQQFDNVYSLIRCCACDAALAACLPRICLFEHQEYAGLRLVLLWQRLLCAASFGADTFGGQPVLQSFAA